jgi:rubrerythrin
VALTRRALLLAAPVAAGAADALARARDDRAIVTAAVDLEQRAAAAYDFAAAGGKLPPALARLAKHLRDQEEEHADGLARALRELGGRRPARPERPVTTPTGRAFGAFALQLENRLIRAYYEAMPRLRPGLRQPLGSIMACEAQHLVVLREALGREPLPAAFEPAPRKR